PGRSKSRPAGGLRNFVSRKICEHRCARGRTRSSGSIRMHSRREWEANPPLTSLLTRIQVPHECSYGVACDSATDLPGWVRVIKLTIRTSIPKTRKGTQTFADLWLNPNNQGDIAKNTETT